MNIETGFPWSAALSIVGFQLLVFAWHVGRRTESHQTGEPGSLPLAEWLNLGSIAVTMFLAVIPTVFGLVPAKFARYAFGFAMALLAGYPFALAAHGGLLDAKPAERALERTMVKTGAIVAAAFLALAVLKMIWARAEG